MADRLSERFSTGINALSNDGFPFVQAQIRKWLRRAHAIESNCICIGRANDRTGRLGPKRQQNQLLNWRDDWPRCSRVGFRRPKVGTKYWLASPVHRDDPPA